MHQDQSHWEHWGSLEISAGTCTAIKDLMAGCLGSVWFWIPIGFAGYILLSMWMMFFMHPLVLAVLPGVLIGILGSLEYQRARLFYRVHFTGFTVNENAIEEYLNMLESS